METSQPVNKKSPIIPGRILYFPENLTREESLQKIASHHFQIGYSYSISVNDETLTRIVAYNDKNDILYCWMSEDKLPDRRQCLNRLFMLRQKKIEDKTIVKRFVENYNEYARGRVDSYKKISQGFFPLENLDSLEYFGAYGLPIIEGPQTEQLKRYFKAHYQGLELEKKLEALYLFNLYLFNQTYINFDQKLKEIYSYLALNHLELFQENVAQKFKDGGQYNLEIIKELCYLLNISINDFQKQFGLNGEPKHLQSTTKLKDKILVLFNNPKKKRWT